MKKIFLTALLILAFVPSVMAMSYKEAKTQSKPMVLYLYMQTCSACKGFSPIYESVSSKYSAKFNFVKELIDGSELAAKLNPSSVPAVYIVEPQKGTTSKIDYDCLMSQSCFEGRLDKYGK